MIGVETLPEKKKSESWKFDEGACLKSPNSCSSPLIPCYSLVYKPDSENKFGFEADVSIP